MKALKVKEIKKLARVIYQMKVQRIPLYDIWYLGGGETLDMVYRELAKRGIEVK